jgi:DNA-directed RNA polymerase specialized sigma24 family protein/CheY-like chemotaxis protein
MTQFYELVRDSIPRMRRYGSLLTGSREVADDYAQAWLERLLRDDRASESPADTAALFRVFHGVISAAEISLDTGRKRGAAQLELELLSLPVDQRIAVLLVHVEGFDRRQAAFIMGLDIGAFTERLIHGRARLRHSFCNSVFIVEDEAVATLDIARIVEDCGHSVCGTAADQEQARAAIEAARPALVLADVKLGGAPTGGIDACEEICGRYGLPFVYVTGYPDRVRSVVKRDKVLVVAKPFEPEVLRAAMGQALAGPVAG